MKLLAAVFLSMVLVPTLTCAQSEGDVRLVGTGVTSRGRLEIYWRESGARFVASLVVVLTPPASSWVSPIFITMPITYIEVA